MNSALGWLGDIARWFGQLMPRLYNIRKTHAAVKFKHGQAVAVSPGLTIYWPITTDLHVIPVNRRTMELATQSLTAKNGIPIAVGAVVIYRIVDVVAAVSDNFRIRSTIEDTAQSAVFQRCSGKDIDTDTQALELDMKATCMETLSIHGVEIEAVKIIQWSYVLPFKNFNDWSHSNEEKN